VGQPREGKRRGLRRFGRGRRKAEAEPVAEVADEPRLRVGGAEAADLAGRAQRAEVQERDARRVLADRRVELAERHVGGDHPQARVLADQASQPGFDEILEACEQHRDWAALVHNVACIGTSAPEGEGV
jgi:hypothetical protein